MSRSIEIGGNFPIEEEHLSYQETDTILYNFSIYKKNYYTFSGRTAISAILSNISCKKQALIADYTCDSCIRPFFDNEFSFDFYHIKNDLTPDILDLEEKLERLSKNGGGVLFLQTYFGFDTLKEVREGIQKKIYSNIVFIEDLTHSWLSDFSKNGYDFYITSLRKWGSFPDGGVVSTNNEFFNVKQSFEDENKKEVSEYVKASLLKQKYFKEMNNTENTKTVYKDYYPIFKNLNTYFRENTTKLLNISSLSRAIIQNTDFKLLKSNRRNNYKYLLDHIDSEYVSPIFLELPDDVVPLYFPVILNCDRGRFQEILSEYQVYCPFHWPISPFLKNIVDQDSFQKYIFSIVCDHRYSLEDMEFIVNIINQLDLENFNEKVK